MVICPHCQKDVLPMKHFSVFWFVVLLILGILPGALYLVHYAVKRPYCPICKNKF
jgi:hypothetical protein